MSLSCSADVTVHGFCQRSTMVCHQGLCCKCRGCNEREPFHISSETPHEWLLPRQMPSFDVERRRRGWSDLPRGADGPPMIPIECRLAGQATGSDYLLVGAPSLHWAP